MRRFAARPLLALAVAAMGIVDLLSALLSHPPERVRALRHLVPTDVLDTSRTFTLLAGALLLLTANGLRRGKRRAFVTALFLCALSVPVNLLKAGDVEEATTATALMFMLGLNREAVAAIVAIGIYAFGGCWLLEWTYGTREASVARAAQEALYQLFGIGDPVLAVARGQHVVRWYLGSISVMGLTLLIGLVAAMLKPARHLGQHRADAQRVRELLRMHGDSTVAAFALDDDVDWFFSANGRGVIAYRYESDVLLVIGDPVGPPEEIPSLLEGFERFCRQHDWTFAFYQARPEKLAHYRARGWRAVHIGEDPVLWTDRFSLEGPAVGSTRRAGRKVERAGVEVRHFVPGRRAFRDAPDHARLVESLREISAAWLHGREGGEKGFCMGRFDPARLDDVRAARRASAWADSTPRGSTTCGSRSHGRPRPGTARRSARGSRWGHAGGGRSTACAGGPTRPPA